MRRAFDILFSLLILILTLPITAIIAIAVKLSSAGPVIFKQERVGLNRRSFTLYKFRSMRVVKESSRELTVGDDPRVTAIGRILRYVKLDELPQFLNVLRGDMTLIGPRPEVPRYVERYSDEMLRIFDYKPGLTDPASIKYRNEPELLADSEDPEKLYIDTILPEKINMSLEYQSHRNCLTDAGVIMRTVLLVLGRMQV